MPVPAAPAAPPAVDPTPGPNDITNFDQVKGGPPAAHPSKASQARTSAPAAQPPTNGAKEIHLEDTEVANRANRIPQSVWDDLEKFTVNEPGKEEPTAAPAPGAATQPVPSDGSSPPAAPDEAELEKQVQAHKTLKDVRTAFKDALKREREWKREQASTQSKLTNYEAKLKNGDTEAARALSTELEARQKRVTELESQIRLLDYTKSSDFHDKHVKPIAKALEGAYADLNEMLVANEDGTMRKAVEADFNDLVSMPLHQAAAVAKQKFGDLSQEVLAHRRTVIQLKRAQREAIDNASKDSEAALQRQTANQSARIQKLQSAYKQRSNELETRFPDLFKAREGDEEGNGLLEKGHKLVALLDDPQVAEDDRVKVAAEIRHRAASYGRLLRDYNRLQKDLEGAAAKLKSYDKSTPREGTAAPNGVPEGPVDPMERALREIDKLATPGY